MIKIKYSLIIFLFLFSAPAHGIHYPRPKVCAEVKSINHDEQSIVFRVTNLNEDLFLKVGRLTRFLKDGREVDFENLSVGLKGEVTYKSPLLTERYLVIFRWSESGNLDSKLKCD